MKNTSSKELKNTLFNPIISSEIITPQELLKRLTEIHGNSLKQNTYLWITNDKNGFRCIETRDLDKTEKENVFIRHESPGVFARDFTGFLNNWGPVQEKLK